MYSILLVCAGGFSTTMLVEEVKDFLLESSTYRREDFKLEAIGVDLIEGYIGEYNIVLVGPQLGYKFDSIKEMAKRLEKPCVLLDAEIYGEFDGEKIIEEAIRASDEFYR